MTINEAAKLMAGDTLILARNWGRPHPVTFVRTLPKKRKHLASAIVKRFGRLSVKVAIADLDFSNDLDKMATALR